MSQLKVCGLRLGFAPKGLRLGFGT